MKKTVFLLTLFAVTAASQSSKAAAQRKGAAAKTQTAATRTPAASGITIPKDAVEIEPGLFQHKDAKGKLWHYRHTPFGVRKFEPEPADVTASRLAADAAADAAYMTAVEKGDSILFERKTPFGSSRWTKKAAELSEAERIAWERSRKKAQE